MISTRLKFNKHDAQTENSFTDYRERASFCEKNKQKTAPTAYLSSKLFTAVRIIMTVCISAKYLLDFVLQ